MVRDGLDCIVMSHNIKFDKIAKIMTTVDEVISINKVWRFTGISSTAQQNSQPLLIENKFN